MGWAGRLCSCIRAPAALSGRCQQATPAQMATEEGIMPADCVPATACEARSVMGEPGVQAADDAKNDGSLLHNVIAPPIDTERSTSQHKGHDVECGGSVAVEVAQPNIDISAPEPTFEQATGTASPLCRPAADDAFCGIELSFSTDLLAEEVNCSTPSPEDVRLESDTLGNVSFVPAHTDGPHTPEPLCMPEAALLNTATRAECDQVLERPCELVEPIESSEAGGSANTAKSSSADILQHEAMASEIRQETVQTQSAQNEVHNEVIGTVDIGPQGPWPKAAVRTQRVDEEESKRRLEELLLQFGVCERPVFHDANCQFRALAKQLYGSANYHGLVRKSVCAQLRAWPARYADATFNFRFDEYADQMQQKDTWGDDVTLQAAADVYGTHIKVLSGYAGYCIEVEPLERRSTDSLWLAYAASHFNAISHPATATSSRVPPYDGGTNVYNFEPKSDDVDNLSGHHEFSGLKFVGYKCPTCGVLLPSLEQASTHCFQQDVDASSSFRGAHNSSTHHEQPPSITRHINPCTGVAQTVVVSHDGSTWVCGERTLASLLGSPAVDSKKWVATLTRHQLHGLVHEVGQRLLASSNFIQAEYAERARSDEELNMSFLGLDGTATERDLDNAYRKMARRLHPDKNGNSEQAKREFQELQERYESLKERLQNRAGESSGELQKGAGIVYDPADRDSLEVTLWDMLSRLRTILSTQSRL